MKNTHGLDVSHFQEQLQYLVNVTMDTTPFEMARALVKLGLDANPQILSEKQFDPNREQFANEDSVRTELAKALQENESLKARLSDQAAMQLDDYAETISLQMAAARHEKSIEHLNQQLTLANDQIRRLGGVVEGDEEPSGLHAASAPHPRIRNGVQVGMNQDAGPKLLIEDVDILGNMLTRALLGFRLHYLSDEDGAGQQLIDALTPEGETVAYGREEIDLLADHLISDLAECVNKLIEQRSQLQGDPVGSFDKCMDAMADRDAHASRVDQLEREVTRLKSGLFRLVQASPAASVTLTEAIGPFSVGYLAPQEQD